MGAINSLVQIITLNHINEGVCCLLTNQLSYAVAAQRVWSTVASSPTGMQVCVLLSFTSHIEYFELCI